MFENRIAELKTKFPEIEKNLSDPAIIADQKKYVALSKEYAQCKILLDVVAKVEIAKIACKDAQEILHDSSSDEDFKAMAEDELTHNQPLIEALQKELKLLFLPKDEKDDKNIIVEVRAGTGGDEASLFCEEIFSMYQRYAEKHKWKCEVMDSRPTELGGFKEITFSVEGNEVYRRMRYESGTHRVQRVPQTESSGRIHTSAVTVAVLPEADEVDIEIDQNDLRIDVYRAGGPGGQSVNTMDSAVRIVHIPTGTMVQCQDGKSQRQNKLQAMKVLRTRLLQAEEDRVRKERSDQRRSQVGSGDRSEKIRTYNFPQGRVTDHRIPLTLYKLDTVLEGEIDEFMDALIAMDYEQEMKALETSNE
jgi:peptide chain release factor 1